MDLAALQVFLAVADEKSFSRAAQKLYRTQPAVSISIRKLEEWIGQPLFVRGTRAGQLTEAGHLLREYAERMLNLREEVRRSMEDLRELRHGRLSIGVNESSIHALLPALASYRRQFPNIHVQIHRAFSREVPTEVLNYRLDLGVVSFRPLDPNLVATEFLKDELVLVVPPRHRLAKRREVMVKDLGEESFVAHIVESPYRQSVMQLFARLRTPLHMDVELPTIESIKRFVEMNMGVAIVPRMCVQTETKLKTLVEIRIREMKLPRHLFLLYRRDRTLSKAAAAFMRLLQHG
jgi:DNA-binding transcriptional LysR family regulator